MEETGEAASGAGFVSLRGCGLMLLGWFLLGMVWAISTPVSAVMDEPAHMIRMLGVAHGEWYGAPADRTYARCSENGWVVEGSTCSSLTPDGRSAFRLVWRRRHSNPA